MKLWILIFVMIAFCLTFTIYGQSAPIQGLVLYLPFNEGSGKIVKDLSGNNNDGALIGSPKWVKGKFGMALQFNKAENKNRVEVEDNPSLNPASEISCAAWIYFDNFQNSSGIISKYAMAGNQRSYIMFLAHSVDLAVEWACSGDGAFGGNALSVKSPAGSLEQGKWQHIATVFKAKQFQRIYINGELKVDEAITFDRLFDNTAPLLIGQYENANEFTGIIDEVVVFNRALSDAEIKSVMDGQFGIATIDSRGKLASVWGEIKKL